MSSPEPPIFDRLATPYDRGMAPLERLWLRQMREQLVPRARGRVLEIGIGTGANMPFYPPLTSLTAVDESTDMLAVARRRAIALGQDPLLGQMDTEHLAFPSGAFDTVVASLVMCSVVNPRTALAELRRVLCSPGGQILLLEHTRPHVTPLGWLADAANVPWYALQGRCHLNRETHKTVAQAGFLLEHTETKGGGLFRLIVARVAA